jgi:pimeloyl-ACP methyl ester carboxylesterase
MKSIASIPVFEVEFDKNGKLFSPPQLTELQAHVKGQGITDLIVFAHGWNNDMADARDLYTRLFTELGNAVSNGSIPALASRKFAGAVALWPSKKFTDADLIPGGGAASLNKDELRVVKARLKDFAKDTVRLGKSVPASAAVRKKVERATALLKTLETNPKSQEQFVKIVRSLLSEKAAEADDGTKAFFKTKDADVLQNLRKEAVVVAPARGGGAADLSGAGSAGAAGLFSDLGDSIAAGARRLLNFTTYYQMKERAGTVGVNGLAPMLATLRKAAPGMKIHLAGHSFGGRLVTAATAVTTAASRPNTLTLLQAAYSHNGLSSKFDGKADGFFRKVMTGGKVGGPILITHTKNDKAVGIAYPLASRINGVKTAALGDENDPYGGMGRNGAQKTPEAVVGDLLAAGSPYAFAAGKAFNLKADAFIGDHSDICKPQVAWAMLTSIATT